MKSKATDKRTDNLKTKLFELLSAKLLDICWLNANLLAETKGN